MKNLKKVVLAALFAFASLSAFAQVKDRQYYVKLYQKDDRAKNNVDLLYSGDKEFKEAIEKKYIDVNFQYAAGRTLLFEVLKRYNNKPEEFLRLAEFLVKNGADVNMADNDGETPLYYAARYHRKSETRIIDFLLKNNADVKVIKNNGYTIILQLSYDDNPDMDLIKRFIKLGAPLNVSSESYHSPLTSAIKHEHPDLAMLLIESGADVNLKDGCSQYPLSMACKQGDLKLVKLLLSKGANTNVKDNENYTPLHHAIHNGSDY